MEAAAELGHAGIVRRLSLRQEAGSMVSHALLLVVCRVEFVFGLCTLGGYSWPHHEARKGTRSLWTFWGRLFPVKVALPEGPCWDLDCEKRFFTCMSTCTHVRYPKHRFTAQKCENAYMFSLIINMSRPRM